jgi:hypothetical protein
MHFVAIPARLHASSLRVTMIRVTMQRNLFCLMILLAIGGCQPKQPQQQVQHSGDPLAGLSSTGGGLNTSVQTMPPEAAVRNDPCAEHLQNIGGTLLLYWAVNKRMPQQLEELKPLASFDQTIELTCPVSGKPYGYAPQGLAAAGKEKRIVVYDPEPSHHGNRWCLFMVPPQPGQALATEVLEVPEGLFHTFTP